MRRSICFTGLYAYSLFNQNTRYVFGGSEVRAWLLATGLARRPDWDVSFVVFDHGQPAIEQFGHVRLFRQTQYRSYESPVGIPPGRWRRRWTWLAGKMSGLWKRPTVWIGDHSIDRAKFAVYEKIDADIFCILGVTNLSAELARYCELAGKPFVLIAGSDFNFSEIYYDGSTEVDPYGNIGHLCHYTIRRADLIITQTHHQADLCRGRHGRDAVVMANPIDLSDLERPGSGADRDGPVLWIGKSDRTKRPELLLDVARRLPNRRFLMVMNRSVPEIHERILADLPANVDMVERLSFDDTEALFRGAAMLLNTSRFEGFPNTFLQAGKFGVPIASLEVDPDGFIAENGCGVVAAGDIELMAARMAALLADDDAWRRASAAVGERIRTHHDLNGIIDQFIHTLDFGAG